VCNMSQNFLCFISSAMFTRKCVAARRVHVRVRALKTRVCTLFTYEDMSMHNF